MGAGMVLTSCRRVAHPLRRRASETEKEKSEAEAQRRLALGSAKPPFFDIDSARSRSLLCVSGILFNCSFDW